MAKLLFLEVILGFVIYSPSGRHVSQRLCSC